MKRKSQGRLLVDVQDPNETMLRLERAGYQIGDRIDPEKLARYLEVDAVLTSRFQLSKPISTGGAVALAVLFGVGAATNQVSATLNLYDAESGGRLWTYDHTVAGGLGSSPQSVTEAIMNRATKRLPYIRR